jgi:hypothetical protein
MQRRQPAPHIRSPSSRRKSAGGLCSPPGPIPHMARKKNVIPMRIAIVVDGSPASTRAARYVRQHLKETPEVIAPYVRRPIAAQRRDGSRYAESIAIPRTTASSRSNVPRLYLDAGSGMTACPMRDASRATAASRHLACSDLKWVRQCHRYKTHRDVTARTHRCRRSPA